MDDAVVDIDALGARLAREVNAFFKQPYNTFRIARRFIDGSDSRIPLELMGFVILDWDRRFYRTIPPLGWLRQVEGPWCTQIFDTEGEPAIRQMDKRARPEQRGL
jgi:hypothetical protein